MLLSIIIPVFNESRTVEEILRRIDALDIDKELVIVDDASTDRTRSIIDGLNPGLASPAVVLSHRTNQGKGAAVRTGLASARGQYVIIQDADLEYDPADYAKLLDACTTGNLPAVYGSRFMGRPKNMSFANYLGNRGLSLITSLLFGRMITDMETCYKLVRTDILKSLGLRADRFELEPEITAKLLARKIPIREIPIAYSGRNMAEGKKITWKDGLTAVRVLIRERFSL